MQQRRTKVADEVLSYRHGLHKTTPLKTSTVQEIEARKLSRKSFSTMKDFRDNYGGFGSNSTMKLLKEEKVGLGVGEGERRERGHACFVSNVSRSTRLRPSIQPGKPDISQPIARGSFGVEFGAITEHVS